MKFKFVINFGIADLLSLQDLASLYNQKTATNLQQTKGNYSGSFLGSLRVENGF